MATIDIVICVLILVGAVAGYMRGFIKQLSSILGLVVGLVAARLLYAQLAEKLSPALMESPTAAQVVAFIVIWIAVPLLFAFVASLFTRALGHSLLGQLNRWLGAVLGAAGVFVVEALLIAAMEFVDSDNQWISKQQKDASLFYYAIDDLTKQYIPKATRSVQDIIEDSIDEIFKIEASARGQQHIIYGIGTDLCPILPYEQPFSRLSTPHFPAHTAGNPAAHTWQISGLWLVTQQPKAGKACALGHYEGLHASLPRPALMA